MLGLTPAYINETKAALNVVCLDGGIKVITPEGDDTPYKHFLPYIESDEPSEPIKARHKRKLFYCNVGDRGYYIKKYSYRFTQRHFAPFRGFMWSIPMAQRQMQKMLFLRECGADVAEPVMALVRRYAGIKQESVLVMHECPGISFKYFLKDVDDFQQRLHVVAQTFRFLKLSHDNRIHHGDMATHNFIVDSDGDMKAIDLDERKTKWLGPLGNRKELKKWVKKSVRMLGIDAESPFSPKRRAFEHMLEENYPEALKFYREINNKENSL